MTLMSASDMKRHRTAHVDFYVYARRASTTATQPPSRLCVAVGVPSSPAIYHKSVNAIRPIQTISDVHVDAEAASGVLASPITQDTALLLTQPPAADEPDAMPDEIKGAVNACPSVLNSAFECPKVEENVVKDDRIGWRCQWCGKWFSGRHATRALCNGTRAKMKKGIAPCTGPIDLESQRRCV